MRIMGNRKDGRIDAGAKSQTARKKERQMDPDRDSRVRQGERHPTLSPNSLRPAKLTC